MAQNKSGKKPRGGGDQVMTIQEVAHYLGVHTSTIYRYAKEGRIPAFKIGSDWRFSAKHIDAWIDQETTKKKQH